MSRWTLGALADEELVRLAVAGDKAAFAEAVRRHEPVARSLVTRLVGDADLAGDVVQEAVVVALVGLDRLRSPDRFGPWLCGIALNVARRSARLGRRTWPAGPLAATVADPQAATEASDLAARVRTAVSNLSPAQRDAVLLFYLQGLTHREVADELGISVGTVKSRLHAGRLALAPRLMALVEPAPHDNRPKDITVPDTSLNTTPPTPAFVDATIAEIRRGPDDTAPADALHVIVLREVGGDRELPIWVGSPEATSLALTIESVETPRPMTFQLATDLLGAAGSRVQEVRLTRIADSVFYATVGIEGPAGPAEVDARPSDALNLAAITGAPIRVGAELFEAGPWPGRADWRSFATDANVLAGEVTDRLAQLLSTRPEDDHPV